MSRRSKIICGLLACLCIAIVLYGVQVMGNFSQQIAAINPANVAKLRIGMTRNELHEKFGRPVMQAYIVGKLDEKNQLTINLHPPSYKELVASGGYSEFIYDFWYSPSVSIMVYYDKNDQVAHIHQYGGQQGTLAGRIFQLVMPKPAVTWQSVKDD